MERNAIESDFRSSKMAQIGLPFWKKIKVAYWSEMARNAFESDFRSSKMVAGSHFVKLKKNRSCVLIWNGEKVIESNFRSSKMAATSHFVKQNLSCILRMARKRSKVIFGHPKWPPAAIMWKKSCVLIWNGEKCIRKCFRSSKMVAGSHFVKFLKKFKVVYWSEMAKNVIESDLRSSKMAAGSHFVKKNQSCVLTWNGEKCDQKWFSVNQNGRWQPFCETKLKLRIDLKWWEMRSKVIFGHPRWPSAPILWTN